MKRALVTGGSGEIGAEICRYLAKQGLHVWVHANQNREQAETVVKAICAEGGSAEATVCDLADPKACSAWAETLLMKGPVQVLVHSAGIHDDALLAGMQPKQWQNVIDVSLNAFYHITQPLLLPMMATRWGRIVALSSVAARGNRGQVNYAAAKGGLEAAVRALALEVASRGITANAVAPGIIASKMTELAFPPEKIAALVPMKRAGTAAEVAALVSFLVSDSAAYISGQTIGINGALAL